MAHDELVAFQQRQHLVGWRWPQPTLIVVDYAAASTRVLRRWLEQLAEHQGGGERKLRLLPNGIARDQAEVLALQEQQALQLPSMNSASIATALTRCAGWPTRRSKRSDPI